MAYTHVGSHMACLMFDAGGVELGTGEGLPTPNLATLGGGPDMAGALFTLN